MSLNGIEQEYSGWRDNREFLQLGLEQKEVFIPQFSRFLETFYSSGMDFRHLVDWSHDYDRPTKAFESMFFGRASHIVGQPYVEKLGREHRIKPTGLEGYLVGKYKGAEAKLRYIAQTGMAFQYDIALKSGEGRLRELSALLGNKPLDLPKEEEQKVWALGESTFHEVITQFKDLYETMDTNGRQEHDDFRAHTYELLNDTPPIAYNRCGMSFWLPKSLIFKGEPYGVNFNRKEYEGYIFIRHLRMFALPPIRVGMQMWKGDLDRGKDEWYLKHLKNG